MAAAEPVLIKKYSNRRLYDTGNSRYVTLDELSEKVRRGTDVRVVDAGTGEDLTQSTLTQIIVEGRGAARLLPVSLLTQLIRLGDDALAEFLGRYVTGALELYLQARRGVETVAPYNPLATLSLATSDALTRLWMASSFAGGAIPRTPWSEPPGPRPEPTGSGASPASEAASTRDDIQALRREIEDLKRLVKHRDDE